MASSSDEATATEEGAFWNTNLPTSRHTSTCPDYLTYAFTNDKDRAILATRDADYHRQTWPDIQQSIRDNRLDVFTRVPSDLRRYREYTAQLAKDHGSVMEFVLKERLRWGDLGAEGKEMFACQDDYKILQNDWPYGIDPRIVHLVVWTKFDLPSEPVTEARPLGDLTPDARRRIDDFVTATFIGAGKVDEDRIIWFKNWGSLKSIHAVEHFHVMLFDPDPEYVKRITNGDVSLAEKMAREERGERE